MITVTLQAQSKLEEILDAEIWEGSAIRLGAVRGPHGCLHGWSLEVEKDVRPDDQVSTVGRLQILVEPALATALEGATIDFRGAGPAPGFAIVAPHSRPPRHEGGCPPG